MANHSKATRYSLKLAMGYSIFAVLLLWVIKSFEIHTGWSGSLLGIYPRELSALTGVFVAPLIHGSLAHLFNNTLPMLLLGTGLLYGYPRDRWKVLGFVWVVSGLGVWCFARPAWHIGASGITHGIFFYLFVVSIFRRDKSSVAIMMIAFLLYGGMTMTIFPRDPQISFEYHFFGALAGAVAAMIWRKETVLVKEKRYDWQEIDEDDPVIGDQWKLPPSDIRENTQCDKSHPPVSSDHDISPR